MPPLTLDIDHLTDAAGHTFEFEGQRYAVFRPHMMPYHEIPEPDGETVFAPREQEYRDAGYRYLLIDNDNYADSNTVNG